MISAQDFADLVELAMLGCRTSRDKRFVEGIIAVYNESMKQGQEKAAASSAPPAAPDEWKTEPVKRLNDPNPNGKLHVPEGQIPGQG